MTKLSHVDASGAARMVDVGAKPATARIAIAGGHIRLAPATIAAIRDGSAAKGDVIAVARIAGIMAAKRTADLIPLCHPLAISACEVEAEIDAQCIRITAEVRTTGPTGVEMEALTAVSVALLTLYDMVKAIDRAAEIGGIALLAKSGGKSGDFQRDTA